MVHPQTDAPSCCLAWAAKVVCSAVFIAGRDPQRALAESAAWMLLSREDLRRILAGGDRAGIRLDVEIAVDHQQRAVTLASRGRRASARFLGDQGAIVVAHPEEPPHFTPRAILPATPDPATRDWPLGDRLVDESRLGRAARAALECAADRIFANPAQLATAFLVVHRGVLVIERYATGFDRETRFEGWSMGKSVIAALVGCAIQDGTVALDEDGLFPEWCEPDDPRRHVRLRHLLQMNSGLACDGAYGSDEDLSQREHQGRLLDHIYVYAGGIDAYAFCSALPAEQPPATTGRYRNCDPLLAMRLLRDRVGPDFLAWPQRRLFDPLGIRGFVMETDPFGNPLLTGHDHARARDWARLGLLFLHEGEADGRALLPSEFVRFARTPAPGFPRPERGALFALNRTGLLPLPEDAYWMSGAGVSKTIIVPSLDLVVVRLGQIAGRVAGESATLAEALAGISIAIASEPQTER